MDILKGWIQEYIRPWKLVSLFVGITLLIWGSLYFRIIDWDVPISIIMAVAAYITAPWSLHVIMERKWKQIPMMLVAVWFSVDGCYLLYWKFKNPDAIVIMREANFFASLSLYGMCGLVWYYRGSLKEFGFDLKSKFLKRDDWGRTFKNHL